MKRGSLCADFLCPLLSGCLGELRSKRKEITIYQRINE